MMSRVARLCRKFKFDGIRSDASFQSARECSSCLEEMFKVVHVISTCVDYELGCIF